MSGFEGALVAGLISVSVSLALSAIFRPSDTSSEGARRDTNFASGALGQFVEIDFGTNRLDFHCIEATDPPVTETPFDETIGGKGPLLGGPKHTTTNFRYSFTGRYAGGIEAPGSEVVRIWANRKLCYDATSTNTFRRNGFNFVYYPGGPTQAQDPEEVERRGPDTPAYRHLKTLKFTDLDLEDMGGMPPFIQVEVAHAVVSQAPFLTLDEPSGFDAPGSLTGAAVNRMALDPTRDAVYGMKSSPTGLWAASASTLEFRSFGGGAALALVEPVVAPDGFGYTAVDGGIGLFRISQRDMETGEQVAITASDTFIEQGSLYALTMTDVLGGEQTVVMHLPGGTVFPGKLVKAGLVTGMEVFDQFTHTELQVDTLSQMVIPDPKNFRFLMVSNFDDGGQSKYRLIECAFSFQMDIVGTALLPNFNVLRDFTCGGPGDDFESADFMSGWAFNPDTGQLILSNNSNMLSYDVDTDTILASRQDLGFNCHNNHFFGVDWAFPVTGAVTGLIYLIDTRTLEIRRTVATQDIPWPGGPGDPVLHDQSSVWDDKTGAIIASRVDVSSSVPTDGRVVKVFVGRINSLGVALDEVVESICTRYQRQDMVGLATDDLDVSTLAGEEVPGYRLGARMTGRDALQPLRSRYFFDAVQSDWGIKFPLRGGTAVLSVPEQDLGELHKGLESTDDPPVREVLEQHRELPMRLSVKYLNKDLDYQPDVDHDKRHRNPTRTVQTVNEKTLEFPGLVATATPMKRVAQQWLYTMWHERRRLHTVIPWTYLELDPTDVFNTTWQGEVLKMRMGELDVGANLSMQVSAIVEDSRNYDSTIDAGTNDGFSPSTIPSNLPTRVLHLDAPLLSLQDLQTAPVSNAYAAMTAFGTPWPGATLYRSIDDADYQQVASAGTEAVRAKVKVAPAAWDGSNVFQDTTMTIVTLRRKDEWASATEEAVLNGANALAVVTAAGVEVLQFQTRTVNDDNTVELSQLLRGRLGTEDVALAGMVAGDEVVLLSGADGSLQSAAVLKTSLSTALLDTNLFYRAVTVGTPLSDANPVTFAYTGRDLKPLSPVDIHMTLGNQGGLMVDQGGVVSFIRRFRGPEAVYVNPPLNETIEEYDLEVVRDADGVILHSDTSEEEEFTVPLDVMAEELYGEASNLLTNGDAETGVIAPWVDLSSHAPWTVATLPVGLTTTSDPNFPAGTSSVIRNVGDPGAGGVFLLSQTVALSASVGGDFSGIDAGKGSILFSASISAPSASDECGGSLKIRALDGSGSQIGSDINCERNHTTNNGAWKRIHLYAELPSGTRSVALILRTVRASTLPGALDENDVQDNLNSIDIDMIFDNVTALFNGGGETFTLRVFQKSEFVGRGLPGAGVFPEE